MAGPLSKVRRELLVVCHAQHGMGFVFTVQDHEFYVDSLSRQG